MIVQALVIWMLLICAALGLARLAGVGGRVQQPARMATDLPGTGRPWPASAANSGRANGRA